MSECRRQQDSTDTVRTSQCYRTQSELVRDIGMCVLTFPPLSRTQDNKLKKICTKTQSDTINHITINTINPKRVRKDCEALKFESSKCQLIWLSVINEMHKCKKLFIVLASPPLRFFCHSSGSSPSLVRRCSNAGLNNALVRMSATFSAEAM